MYVNLYRDFSSVFLLSFQQMSHTQMTRVAVRISTNVHQFFLQQTLKCIHFTSQRSRQMFPHNGASFWVTGAKNCSDTIESISKETRDGVSLSDEWPNYINHFSHFISANSKKEKKTLEFSYFIFSFATHCYAHCHQTFSPPKWTLAISDSTGKIQMSLQKVVVLFFHTCAKEKNLNGISLRRLCWIKPEYLPRIQVLNSDIVLKRAYLFNFQFETIFRSASSKKSVIIMFCWWIICFETNKIWSIYVLSNLSN